MIISNKQKTFFDLFPTPEFLLFSTTGIVITDTDIKFVQLRKKMFGDGFELIHASKIDNPKGIVESGIINNPSELTSILQNLSAHYSIHYTRANLPDEKAYLFTAYINWVPHEGLNDAIAFIIEENAPVSLAESVFDFEIISEDKRAGKIKLAVSVLPKNVVETYVKIFESVGVTPVSFDLESQAIARAVIRQGDKQPILIINLSPEKTGFYVVEEGVVQFSTTLSYGIDGDGSYKNLNDLKVEMNKIFGFWEDLVNKSGQTGKKIEKVVLCGIGGNKTDFVEKLMSESKIPYSLADVWQNMFSAKSHVPEISFDVSLDYASVIGLVLPYDR